MGLIARERQRTKWSAQVRTILFRSAHGEAEKPFIIKGWSAGPHRSAHYKLVGRSKV